MWNTTPNTSDNTWDSTSVLLQPTGGFFWPSSTCCSGQLTRSSVYPCQSRWPGYMALRSSRRNFLAPSSAKINTHFVCLLGCSALPLGLKQTNCVFSSIQNRSCRAGDGISHNPAGNSQQLQIAVAENGRRYGKMAMCVKNKGLFKQHFMFTYDHWRGWIEEVYVMPWHSPGICLFSAQCIFWTCWGLCLCISEVLAVSDRDSHQLFCLCQALAKLSLGDKEPPLKSGTQYHCWWPQFMCWK